MNTAPTRKMYVRVPNVVRRALKNTLERVNDAGLRFGDSDITQEQLVAATWLWMRDQSAGDLIARFEPYVRRLEAIMAGQPGPGGADGGLPPSVRAATAGGNEPDDGRPGAARPQSRPSPGAVVPEKFTKKRGR